MKILQVQIFQLQCKKITVRGVMFELIEYMTYFILQKYN